MSLVSNTWSALIRRKYSDTGICLSTGGSKDCMSEEWYIVVKEVLVVQLCLVARPLPLNLFNVSGIFAACCSDLSSAGNARYIQDCVVRFETKHKHRLHGIETRNAFERVL